MEIIKCVVWDLDNTIWNGILSESTDIKLRGVVPEILEFFKSKGIVNSIASRNEKNITLIRLKEMGIEEYFVYPQISWGTKIESINRIISSLHIRPHNILFIDDSQFERDSVSSAFNGIHVHDGNDLNSVLQRKEFLAEYSSEEALKRFTMYKVEEKRLTDRGGFHGTEQEFLASCNIQATIKQAKNGDIERIQELIDRTNQMNSTGIRYSRHEVEQFLVKENHIMFVADIQDKYGDYGRSGLLIVCKEPSTDVLEVKQLIVSCRLMGKGIAQTLLYYAYRLALQQNNQTLRCPFIRNEFNRQMILLYTQNQFRLSNKIEDISYYELEVNKNQISKPNWVNLL